MWDAAGGIVWVYVLLTFIGLGPALYLFRNSFTTAIATAPTIGLASTALFGSYFILLDYPVITWARGWIITAGLLSLLLSFNYLRTNKVNIKNIQYFLPGFCITTLLILLPYILGGLNFTIFRGNGTDAFNYMTMAEYLLHEPLSWIYSANAQELMSHHPIYPLAQILLNNTRWSTSMLMGWTAQLTHLSLYRIEYGFTTLFMMMTFGCAYCFLNLLRLRQLYAVFIAAAICVGFWGQFVIDIRAMSQLSALPLLLLTSVIIVNKQEGHETTSYTCNVILSLNLTALAILYIEILPLVCLGLVFFASILLYTKQARLVDLIKNYYLTIILAIIALIPVAHYLISLFSLQINFAVNIKNNWDLAYFHWLYNNPFLGFWGFSYFFYFPKAILMILSVTLTLLFVYLIGRTFIKINIIPIGLTFSLAFFTAGLFEWAYLFFNDQLWAAGKALSYTYPFIFFIMAGIFIFPRPIQKKPFLFYFCKYSVLTWLLIQCGLSFLRIDNVLHKQDYQHYIGNHGYYMQHQWDINSLAIAIKKQKIKNVGLAVPDTWLTEYLIFALQDNTQVINLNGLPDRSSQIFASNIKPSYCIIQTCDTRVTHANVIAQTPEFSLIKC